MFTFQQFTIKQDRCAMKVGTDGVLLGAWAAKGMTPCAPRRILDIGTGTGLVALMMAQRFPEAVVDAVELDAVAAAQATENVACSPFAHRVRVLHCSIQDFTSSFRRDSSGTAMPYDVIVSNPPYFQNSLKNPNNHRMLARHTDTLPYSELLTCAKLLLSREGVFCVILPTAGCLESFIEESVFQGFLVFRQTFIRTSSKKAPKRCLVALGTRRSGEAETSEECLLTADGQRSEWYQKLTKNFYL